MRVRVVTLNGQPLFTDSQLDTLAQAARILAAKRIEVALELQGKQCYAAAVLSRLRNKIDNALRNYPDWRVIAKELEV